MLYVGQSFYHKNPFSAWQVTRYNISQNSYILLYPYNARIIFRQVLVRLFYPLLSHMVYQFIHGSQEKKINDDNLIRASDNMQISSIDSNKYTICFAQQRVYNLTNIMFKIVYFFSNRQNRLLYTLKPNVNF